jgi:hypothetical protein
MHLLKCIALAFAALVGVPFAFAALVGVLFALAALVGVPFAVAALVGVLFALAALVGEPFALAALVGVPFAFAALVGKCCALAALVGEPFAFACGFHIRAIPTIRDLEPNVFLVTGTTVYTYMKTAGHIGSKNHKSLGGHGVGFGSVLSVVKKMSACVLQGCLTYLSYRVVSQISFLKL